MKVQSELTGIVEKVYAPEEAGNFKWRNCLVRVPFQMNDEEHFNYYPIQLQGDVLDTFSGVNVGDQVKVAFDIRGKMWMDGGTPKTNKKGQEIIFTNLVATSFELLGKPQPASGPAPQEAPKSESEEDDLPF